MQFNQRARKLAWLLRQPSMHFPMTGVISALPVNHRVGGLLKNLILKIGSRVNDRRCLWGKLLSSMIRDPLNVISIIMLVVYGPWALAKKWQKVNSSCCYTFSFFREPSCKFSRFLHVLISYLNYRLSLMWYVLEPRALSDTTRNIGGHFHWRHIYSWSQV